MELHFGNTNNNVFGLTFSSWKYVCNHYLNLEKDAYIQDIQLFPLYKLTDNDKNVLKSKKFFYNNISNGFFTSSNEFNYCKQGYVLDDNFNIKESKLISPIMFLTLEAIGYELFKHKLRNKNSCIKFFYTKKENNLPALSKYTYENFVSCININKNKYNYFIHYDKLSFYKSFNKEYLKKVLNKLCNYENTFNNNQINNIINLFSLCGGGNFPLFKTNTASRFLALDLCHYDSDHKLYEYLKNDSSISSFCIIRNGDDTYILFNSIHKKLNLKNYCKKIKIVYGSILSGQNCVLNDKKTSFGKTRDLKIKINPGSKISKAVNKLYKIYACTTGSSVYSITNMLLEKYMRIKQENNNLTILETYYIIRLLLQSSTKQNELQEILRNSNKNLFDYYERFCKNSFMQNFEMRKTNNVLLSIIIPFWNREKSLKRCIESVLNQDFNNYELILIDDGSQDSSPNIADNFACKHKNISIYHREHQGTIASRNFAVKKALGEYIVFVDSDDYVKNGYFKEIKKNITNWNKPDCIGFNQIKKLVNGYTNNKYWPVYKFMGKDEIITQLLPNIFNLHSFITCSILVIKKNLLEKHLCKNTNLKCPEDILFTYKCIYEANNILTINKEFYVYDKTNINSTTHDSNISIKDKILAFTYLYKTFENSEQVIKDNLTHAFIWKFISEDIIKMKIDFKFNNKKILFELKKSENEINYVIKLLKKNKLQNIDKKFSIKLFIKCLKHHFYRLTILLIQINYNLLKDKDFER